MRFYLSVRLRCANPRHVFPYCQHFFHLLCAFRIWVIGNITYREAPRTCRARVFIHSRSNLYSINGRMYALRRVWMRESVTIRRGSAYETELETFPPRNISGSFKSYLGFYTRGKWSTTSDSNGNFNGFEPFLSASWSSGRCKPQKEGESSHTSHMLFRGFVFFLPHISLRLQNTKGQLSLVALVEFESTLNGFSYYSMLPWPHFCVVVWTLSLPYHTT